MIAKEVKAKFILEQATKMYSSTLSLTSALDEWRATPRPGYFTTGREQVPIV